MMKCRLVAAHPGFSVAARLMLSGLAPNSAAQPMYEIRSTLRTQPNKNECVIADVEAFSPGSADATFGGFHGGQHNLGPIFFNALGLPGGACMPFFSVGWQDGPPFPVEPRRCRLAAVHATREHVVLHLSGEALHVGVHARRVPDESVPKVDCDHGAVDLLIRPAFVVPLRLRRLVKFAFL